MDIRVKKPEEMESEELVPLTPGLIRQYKDNINLAFAPYRWRRFVLRLVDRVIWHWHGLLLWLVQRPFLRYLPYPYPAVFLFDVTPFQLFQEHTQQLFALEGNSIKNCFQAWYHVIRRGHARKQMRTTAKMARRQRLQRIFDLAGRAEQAHDHFTLYQAIHELAPKKWYRRFQLRDPNGHLLNPDQAADMLQEWFQQLYNDDSAPLSSHSFQWPFSEEGMREGFQQMPLLKAVAPEYAPSPYWQCAAHNIAAYLTPYLRDC